jgi:hypothetical protein
MKFAIDNRRIPLDAARSSVILLLPLFKTIHLFTRFRKLRNSIFSCCPTLDMHI